MRRNIRDAGKYTASLLLAAVLAGVSGVAVAQISQQPLSLSEGVPPNMIFTIDDSLSMVAAYAPDGMRVHGATRRAKSSAFNPMYYDPTVTYVAPKTVSASGVESQLTTSFGAAYHNGFNTTRGNVNLADAYKVTWTYSLAAAALPTSYGDPGTGFSLMLAENPAADFACSVTSLTTNNQSKTCTIAGGRTVTITRTSSTACTATSTGWVSGACSVTSGTWTGSWAQRAVPAYYYAHSGSPSCLVTTESCYTLQFVPVSQEQNFANWYSFYRNRALATLSAASLAFLDLSPAVRLTWQGLGNCNGLDGGNATNCKDNKLRAYTPAHKGQLYAFLKDTNFNVGGTPLPTAMKRAGEFLKGETAWQKFPNESSGNNSDNVYACRPSYHVMMTDGIWNNNVGGAVAAPSGYRQDSSTFNLPDNRGYTGQHPFYDATTETLADMAMHYWATDLRSGLANRVPTYVPFKSGDAATDYWDPRNNPATWQHMVNFLMGLGLTESMNNPNIPWEGGTFAGSGYQALKAGTVNWPAASPANNGSPNNVYDLWHAAINSRGEFFSVDNPDAMVRAFKSILDRIAERMGSAASPAINSGQLEEAGESLVSYAFHTYYYSDEGWAGDLKAFTKRRQLNEETNQYEVITEEDWSARALLDGRTEARNINIAGTGSTGLQAFTWSSAGDASATGTLANLLRNDLDNVESPCNSASCAEKRLNFLRGDRSDEGTLFRQRRSILGDMVSSKPVSVRGARYLVGYANSIERNNKYRAFLEARETRAPRIYVGANDGMLHAFDALNGQETFAFVPTAVFPNLYRLTGKTYNHHFYVDGSPVVADAYIGDAWRTVLIGTLRAGGKGLFALDITDPANIKLLWEFSDARIPAINGVNNQVRLGYSFPQPTVARLHNGKWAVVTGNGYDSDGSTHGKAALLIIDLETGALTKSIEVQGTAGVANGLSAPRLADMNVDGVADYAYAGDLQGNLWRFNLTPPQTEENVNPFKRAELEVDNATTRSHFKASYGGKPLFSAVTASGERQPITAAPNIVRHPSRHGYLVVVGAGKYFETPDRNSEQQQSLYGIWDTNTLSTSGSESGPGGVSPTGSLARAQLQQQTYDAEGEVDGSIRTLSRNPVKWAIPPASSTASWTDNDEHKYGWYFDLSLTGEMVVENMILFGQSLLLQTLVPDDDPCASGASSWTYGIDAMTGGRTRHHIFRDIRHPSDPLKPVTAYKQNGEGGLTLGQSPDGSFEICTGENCLRVDPDPESVGRQSWRQVGEE